MPSLFYPVEKHLPAHKMKGAKTGMQWVASIGSMPVRAGGF
jgi:hypothetical protein